MRRFPACEIFPAVVAFCLLVMCVSCAPVGGSHSVPVPQPRPADPIEAAAAQYLADYANNLAAAADTVAAGDYRSWEDGFGAWQKATKAAREDASKALDAAVQSTGEFGEFDPERFRKIVQSHGAGFRGAKQ